MTEWYEEYGITNPFYGDDWVCILKGDCREVLPLILEKSIDLLYANPPFGITNTKWDTPLDWSSLWPSIWRVLKADAPAVIHASMPFNYNLVSTQRQYFRYEYIWEKNIATGFFIAQNQPLRRHENICVFYKKQPTYNPQMVGNGFHNKRLVKHGGSEQYWGEAKYDKQWGVETAQGGHYGRYPSTILSYDTKKSSPRQEDAQTNPYELIDYFINTYTNPDATILDFCCYKGDRPLRAKLLNRRCIGIEIEEKYCEIAAKRCSQGVFDLRGEL